MLQVKLSSSPKLNRQGEETNASPVSQHCAPHPHQPHCICHQDQDQDQNQDQDQHQDQDQDQDQDTEEFFIAEESERNQMLPPLQRIV